MSDLRVRRAEPSDLVEIVSLSEEWAAEDITFGQTADSGAWFEARLGAYFFIGDIEATTVGFALGELRTSNERVSAVLTAGTRYVEVTNLYVRRAWRSRSIGSQLLAAVLDAAATDGVERSLPFTGAKDAHAALRFYERHGYRSWGIQLIR